MEMKRQEGLPEALEALSSEVIGAAIEVHRHLGPGFAEQTYHRAMMVELGLRKISFTSEAPVQLTYKDEAIGEGRIDLVVEDQLIIELKAAEANARKYKRQVVAYLKATNRRLGLVINFEAEVLKQGLNRVIHTPNP